MPKTAPIFLLFLLVFFSSCTPQKDDPTTAREKFRRDLGGTTWYWGDGTEIVTFGTDGKIFNPGWDARSLVVSWEAIDRRTVLLILDKGRDHDRYAVLTFSEDLSEYGGFDFENATRLHQNRRK